ncbi:alpha-mannosidase 2 isoform X2 [Carcharodon carcharias]|uniref:alpha-mannosidase 2 isoform X2 n=1 Tax=Carcharodon carcharias TaxID=13397 RepID=UPI001B7EFE46|nr:alpha-mannosidase 2 isoform X2 [Carcharodon carcharias]
MCKNTLKMRLSRQFTIFGSAIFCVVIVSLYLMLDHVQFDHPKNVKKGGIFPNAQLSILHEKIDHLERLLAENNEIISNIRDSVINLSESVKDNRGDFDTSNSSKGLSSEIFGSSFSVIPIEPEDCQFASKGYTKASNLQMLDIYNILPFDNPDGGVWKQGFDITYNEHEWDDEPLQVFVVPHSHNDPGWLKTFDEYYKDQTQHILNNMVVKLQEDVRRKFIWSEISFFSKWWSTIDSQKKDAVKRLCELGQFEITTGGWVMTDEANTHIYAMIDQLFEGHQWLERNLGIKPRSGWAIDPFGHTPTMAYLLKQTGISNMLIQRVHYSVKKYLAKQRNLEFFWRQNWDQNGNTDILCQMMPFYSYDVPHTCGPDPKICCQFDFKRLPGGRISCPWRIPPIEIHDDNVQERAKLILDQYRKKSKLYRTKVVLIPLGDDFRYDQLSEWDQQFQNYQKLFDYMNSHPELHVKAQFGTLSDYFDALHKAADSGNSPSPFPVLSGDFFTYADRDDHYWSGYFTSRPFYKRMDRVLESHLRAAEILYSLALVGVQKSNKMATFPSSENYKLLKEARRNLGLFQHHDAITGTAKEWVVVDYGTRLFHSIMNLKKVIGDSAHFLMLKDKENYKHVPSTPFLQMDDSQASQDSLPQRTTIDLSLIPRFLVLYNPTDQNRISVVTVQINSHKVRVLTASGQPVEAQISAVWDKPTAVSKEVFQVSFVAQISALGLGLYQLVKAPDIKTVPADYTVYLNGREEISIDSPFKINVLKSHAGDITFENSNLKAWFSGTKGFLEKINTKEDKREHQINIQFWWYGTTSNRDKSGAYLFLPNGEAKPYVPSEPPILRITRGPLFSEMVCIYQHFTHSVRLNNVYGIDGLSLEISNIVDIRGEINQEIAMRLITDVKSNNQFYTDLNDFQMQPRQTLSKLPLQANFYPLTTTAYIQDNDVRVTLHSAQSLGVASLKSGQLEVIMDRRLVQDDNRGLGQGLKDNKITANLFRVLLERRIGVDMDEGNKAVNYPSLLSHKINSNLNHPVIPMVVNPNVDGIPPLLNLYSPLMSSMPCDMHILNLRTIEGKDEGSPSDEAALIIHRMGFDCRFLNKNTGLFCSTTRGKIPVHNLFRELKIQHLIPSTLTLMHTAQDHNNTRDIELNPMGISTFRIQLS